MAYRFDPYTTPLLGETLYSLHLTGKDRYTLLRLASLIMNHPPHEDTLSLLYRVSPGAPLAPYFTEEELETIAHLYHSL